MIILTFITITNGFVSFWSFDAKQKYDTGNRNNVEDSEMGNIGETQRELRIVGEVPREQRIAGEVSREQRISVDKTADKSLNDKPAEAPKWIVALNYLTFSAGILMETANFFIQYNPRNGVQATVHIICRGTARRAPTFIIFKSSSF